jgi:hypothetical protein
MHKSLIPLDQVEQRARRQAETPLIALFKFPGELSMPRLEMIVASIGRSLLIISDLVVGAQAGEDAGCQFDRLLIRQPPANQKKSPSRGARVIRG